MRASCYDDFGCDSNRHRGHFCVCMRHGFHTGSRNEVTASCIIAVIRQYILRGTYCSGDDEVRGDRESWSLEKHDQISTSRISIHFLFEFNTHEEEPSAFWEHKDTKSPPKKGSKSTWLSSHATTDQIDAFTPIFRPSP